MVDAAAEISCGHIYVEALTGTMSWIHYDPDIEDEVTELSAHVDRNSDLTQR